MGTRKQNHRPNAHNASESEKEQEPPKINNLLHRPFQTLLLLFLPWYFIPRVLKLAKVKMYVRNGYNGDSETVNVLARHTALKAELSLKYVGTET